MARAGCRIRHIAVERPSLEDVYLRAVRDLPAETRLTHEGITTG